MMLYRNLVRSKTEYAFWHSVTGFIMLKLRKEYLILSVVTDFLKLVVSANVLDNLKTAQFEILFYFDILFIKKFI
jgi:hypothetical protein